MTTRRSFSSTTSRRRSSPRPGRACGGRLPAGRFRRRGRPGAKRGVEDDAAPGLQAGAAACHRTRDRLLRSLRNQFDRIDLDAVETVGQGMPDLSFGGRRATAGDDGDPVGSARRREAWSSADDAIRRPFGQQRIFDAGRADDEGAARLADAPDLACRQVPASPGCRHRQARWPRHSPPGDRMLAIAIGRLQRRQVEQCPRRAPVCRDRWISRSDSSIGVIGWRLITGWRSMRKYWPR